MGFILFGVIVNIFIIKGFVVDTFKLCKRVEATLGNIEYTYDNTEDGVQIHDYLEILYVLSGRLAIFYNGKNYVLQQEDFVVINPFVSHETYKEKGCHIISFYISSSLLVAHRIPNIECNSRLISGSSAVVSIRKQLAFLLEDLIKSDSNNEIFLESKLLILLGTLKMYFSKDDEKHVDAAELRTEKIRDILFYIHSHFQERCSSSEIANRFYLSQGYFSKLFEKHMGISYSNYVRNLRLSHGEKLLLTSTKQVVEISEECGFENVNTFIENFKSRYKETPNQYRKKHSIGDNIEREDISNKKDRTLLYSLLKYATTSQDEYNQSNVMEKSLSLSADLDIENAEVCSAVFKTINMGYAINILNPKVQGIVKKAKEDFGFQYLYIQGIFDEDLSVFTRDDKNQLVPNCKLIYQIIDIILSSDLLPWIELSRIPSVLINNPKNIFHNGYVQLPDKIDEWLKLVDHLIHHFVNKYGVKHVSKWRISILPGLYISYDVFTFDEYMDFYSKTVETIRKILPEIQICGGIFDIRLLQAKWNNRDEDLFTRFLIESKKRNVLPDILGVQYFSLDYSNRDAKETEERIVTLAGGDDPVSPTADPDSLKHDHQLLRACIEKANVDISIAYISWNSSIWYSDLGNDTCFKSAYLVKNALENSANIDSLCYGVLYDDAGDSVLFGGGYGLVTEKLIPKADYYGLYLLKKIADKHVIEQGEGYCFLKNNLSDEYYLMLYHYCHYDLNLRIEELIPREEQRTIDRYYAFVNDGLWNMHIQIKNLIEGIWEREDVIVGRTSGSSYDKWMEMGSPNILNEYQRDYLISAAKPKIIIKEEKVGDSGELDINAILEPHDIRLIKLKYLKSRD